MRCEYAHDDGAYVLGALCPTERAAYERHLATCPVCREAVAEMAVLPGLLARLGPADAERITLEAGAVEASRLPKLLLAAAADTRRRLRRRRVGRFVVAGLGAACLIVVAGLGLALHGAPGVDGDQPPVAMVAMDTTSAGARYGVTAEVALVAVPGGTKIWMRCSYPPSVEHRKAYMFRLIAFGTDGGSESIGSWRAAPGDALSMDGLTRFTPAELDRLELRKGDETPLLIYNVT